MYLIKPLLSKLFTVSSGQLFRSIAFFCLILFLLRGLGSFLSSYFIGKMGSRVIYEFRYRIFKKFLTLPSSYYDKTSSGKLLSKILYNIDQVTNATSYAVITIIQDGTFVIGLICVMICISWQLFVTVIILSPFLASFVIWISKKFRYYSVKMQNSIGLVTQIAEEALANYKEIRIFNKQVDQRLQFKKQLLYTYKQQKKTFLLNGIASPVTQFIGALVTVSILIIVSTFSLKTNNWLDTSSFVAFLAVMVAILKPVKNLININAILQKGIVAISDIFTVIDYQSERDSGKSILINLPGNITFKNVNFMYANTKNFALRNITFSVERGERVAIVGRSGCGKSTIINLLLRFYYPTSGNIFLDKKDISIFTLGSLRFNISLVSQNVHLFNNTIYHNIAYGKSLNITRSEVIQAAKDSNAWNFIKKLPDKLDTYVGQNGLNLSGGQRQRISIARALVNKAPILIFDEATSSLDQESTLIIKKALNKLMSNKITFIVTHHLNTIKDVDKVVLLDDGKIIEIGTHQSLILTQKIYKTLCHDNFL
jgi:subfamily B ATP-binding cassette protein MsbA